MDSLLNDLIYLLFGRGLRLDSLSWWFSRPEACASRIGLLRRTANNNLQPVRVHRLLDPDRAER